MLRVNVTVIPFYLQSEQLRMRLIETPIWPYLTFKCRIRTRNIIEKKTFIMLPEQEINVFDCKKYYWFPLEVYPCVVVNREPLLGIS